MRATVDHAFIPRLRVAPAQLADAQTKIEWKIADVAQAHAFNHEIEHVKLVFIVEIEGAATLMACVPRYQRVA